MEFLAEYGLFLAKILTVVIAVLVVVASIVAISSKQDDEQPQFTLKNLNKEFEKVAHALNQKLLGKSEKKAEKKDFKAAKKEAKQQVKPRLFVLHFKGDIKASAVKSLRREISAVLMVAKAGDEVLLCLDSPGGLVNAYGLAAAQLQRLKDKKLHLTVSVDRVAASGGYLMACIADKIIASPFAIIGSIGVIAQLPNFNRLLKKHHVDFEQHTAGEFKRTLTMFGENTRKSREKFVEEIEDVHQLFKAFVENHRPQLSLEKVATGEHWLAQQALELNLVDHIETADDYLMDRRNKMALYQLQYKTKPTLAERITGQAKALVEGLLELSWKSNQY